MMGLRLLSWCNFVKHRLLAENPTRLLRGDSWGLRLACLGRCPWLSEFFSLCLVLDRFFRYTVWPANSGFLSYGELARWLLSPPWISLSSEDVVVVAGSVWFGAPRLTLYWYDDRSVFPYSCFKSCFWICYLVNSQLAIFPSEQNCLCEDVKDDEYDASLFRTFGRTGEKKMILLLSFSWLRWRK